MIVSKKHNFIFIHVTKTGGMSIAQSLEGFGNNIIKKGFGAHTTVKMARADIDNFDSYFSFAVVRNPWDRMYSLYSYFHNLAIIPDIRKGKMQSFNISWNKNNIACYKLDFKTWLMDSKTWAPWDFNKFYPHDQQSQQMFFIGKENGEIGVNYLVRFENLAKGINYVCNEIGIPPVKLPCINTSKHFNYRKAYDKEMIDFVAENHMDDIRNFNYDFEDGI